MDNHDTMVWVRGVSQCANVQHHTHTCSTHFRNTTGISIPMAIPMFVVCEVCVVWFGLLACRHIPYRGLPPTSHSHLLWPMALVAAAVDDGVTVLPRAQR